MFSFIQRLLNGEKLPDPVLTPPGFIGAILPPQDDPEPTAQFIIHEDIDVFGQAFVIVYQDEKKEVSQRRVIGRSCYELHENIMFQAKCLERQATRTFRVDRIKELYCGVTGELLDPISDFISPSEIRESSGAKYSNPIRSAIRVLMTLARADGYVHPKELEILDRFISLAKAHAGPSVNVTALRKYAERLAPDFEGFLDAAEVAFKGKHQFAFEFIECARLLVKADGVVTDEEHILIDDLMHLARAEEVVKRGDRFTPI